MAVRLKEVIARVAAAANRVGRDRAGVTVVAVSKTASDDDVRVAYGEGVRDFAENRADVIARRAAIFPADIRWHFVGRLQGNKVRLVRPVTVLLHSLDRPELVEYWVKGPGLPPPVLVEVNVGAELQKAGVVPEDAAALVDHAVGMGLDVRGLMTVPPASSDPEASRTHFRALAKLRASISAHHTGVVELSMGMTGDFEVAVEEGATILRIGQAIFGSSPAV